MKNCTKCDTLLTEDNTYNRNDRKGLGSTCKSCFNIYCIERWRNIKQEEVTERGGCCSNCGYDKYIGALEFHHTDPSIKESNFSANWVKWSKKRRTKELDKCVLLCANCHREIHAEMRK